MATNQTLIHYALDLESPPLIACNTPATGAISSPTASEVTCPRCMSSEQFPRLQARQAGTPITTRKLLLTAADLLSDDEENPEYDRAIAELTSALIGGVLPHGSILITRILRALKERS